MAVTAKPGALTPLHSHLKKQLPLVSSTLIRPKSIDSRFSQFNLTQKHPRIAAVIPIIRAQNSPGMDADFLFLFLFLFCKMIHVALNIMQI